MQLCVCVLLFANFVIYWCGGKIRYLQNWIWVTCIYMILAIFWRVDIFYLPKENHVFFCCEWCWSQEDSSYYISESIRKQGKKPVAILDDYVLNIHESDSVLLVITCWHCSGVFCFITSFHRKLCRSRRKGNVIKFNIFNRCFNLVEHWAVVIRRQVFPRYEMVVLYTIYSLVLIRAVY